MSRQGNDKSVLRRSWETVSRYRKTVFGAILISVAVNILANISSFTLRIIVDDILPEQKINLLWPVQLVFIGMILAENLLGVIRKFMMSTVSQRCQADLRARMYSQLINSDYYSKNRKDHSDIIAGINYQVDSLEGIFENGIPSIIANVADVAITIAIMLYVNWKLALISIPVYPMLYITSTVLRKKATTIQSRYQMARKYAIDNITEGLQCGISIRNHKLESYMNSKFQSNIQNVSAESIKIRVLNNIANRIGWALIMVPYQAILYGIGGTWLINSGEPSIGTLLIFANFTNHLIQPIMSLLNISGEIGAAKSAYRYLDEYTQDLPNAEKPRYGEAFGEIAVRLNGLSFTYPEHQQPTLSKISCLIRRNEVVVLWGASGSGKSTLLKIIHGLILPQDSSGIDRNNAMTWGLFSQTPSMFHCSLFDNFRLVNALITEEEMWKKLDMLGVAETVRKKPKGIHHIVGLNESSFSVGEFRRITLAVFLAAEFDGMLLDEPTASLDEDSTLAIMAVLREIKASCNKTLFISSHDKKVLELADQVIEMGSILH